MEYDRSLQYYPEIAALAHMADDQARGYKFEQVVREFLPWTRRPPIAVRTATEQIDAFFEWNSWHFLVEAKSKLGVITGGSHDWEDYELKLRKRKGTCIGLFLSTGPVSKEVESTANMLCKEGMINLLIAGTDWQELEDTGLGLKDYINHAITTAKAQFLAHPKSIREVADALSWQEESARRLSTMCEHASAVFLRRHKGPYHENVYVRRKIDNIITSAARALRPSKLDRSSKTHSKGGHQFKAAREAPPQIALVRDLSGAGKTTLAANLASERTLFFGATQAACQDGVDGIAERLSQLDGHFGLRDIMRANRAIVYVIDSLDEATHIPTKKSEIIALIKFISQANTVAIDQGLICFPILICFTVREDYWRDWEYLFEGLRALVLTKRHSYFTDEETREALRGYGTAYHFRLKGALGREGVRVLSHPFNMQIFAEANQYVGEVDAANVLTKTVLSTYFERKKFDVNKRWIPHFNPNQLMKACAQCAIKVLESKDLTINADTLYDCIDQSTSNSDYIETIATLIVAEQILVHDIEAGQYRFRHTKFVEFLIAYHIVDKLSQDGNPAVLEQLCERYLPHRWLSIANVHELVRHICCERRPDLYDSLTTFYIKSTTYMARFAESRRAKIACGETVSLLDIDILSRAIDESAPDLCWNTFFVVSAKGCRQPLESILRAFESAWQANADNPDRWKILHKMATHQLLLYPSVVKAVLDDSNAREWLVFLDGIIEGGQTNDFVLYWDDLGRDTLPSRHDDGDWEWNRGRDIFKRLIAGEVYERGEMVAV